MAETANYRIGTYEGNPHFQCLLCPRDSLEEGDITGHILRIHHQEPRSKKDDRPKAQEQETTASAAANPEGDQAKPSAASQEAGTSTQSALPVRQQPAGSQDKPQDKGGKE